MKASGCSSGARCPAPAITARRAVPQLLRQCLGTQPEICHVELARRHQSGNREPGKRLGIRLDGSAPRSPGRPSLEVEGPALHARDAIARPAGASGSIQASRTAATAASMSPRCSADSSALPGRLKGAGRFQARRRGGRQHQGRHPLRRDHCYTQRHRPRTSARQGQRARCSAHPWCSTSSHGALFSTGGASPNPGRSIATTR